jgi:hypothetical protein
MEPTDEKEGLKELKHEAWPGFRTVFFIVFAVGAVYLAVLLIRTLGQSPGGHG